MSDPIRATLHVQEDSPIPLHVQDDNPIPITVEPDILPQIIEGISPEVTLEETAEGVIVTVTDKSGPKTALIPKGLKGDDYELTAADKTEIATEAAGMVDLCGAAGRVSSLTATELTSGSVIDNVGIPIYVDDVTDYPGYGITQTGWYTFARINAKTGITVGNSTTVTGADGYIATVGSSYIDVAVRFGVAAQSVKVTIVWDNNETDVFVFRATDLAVRNLDYRSTFYVYDISDFATWTFALTTDATFVYGKQYYKAGETPGTYTLVPQSEMFALTSDATFNGSKSYYTESSGVYTKATVTAGNTVPENTYYELATVTANTYYKHSKLTFSGMIRNVTYRLDDIVDCPIDIVLPQIPDDGYGAWYEIQMRFDSTYSIQLMPTDNTVKIGTTQTQNQTAGINIVDLQYTDLNDVHMWTLLNTHSNIPA